MKQLLILLLFPFIAQSQSKNDEKIIIVPADTADLFNRVVAAIYKYDHTPQVKDDAGKMIVTGKKQLTNINASYTVKAWVNGGKVYLSGMTYLGNGSNGLPIQYKGHKASVFMQAWQGMEAIAGEVPGEKTYSK